VLAYIFSHQPAAGADLAAYEAGLKRFHAALAEMKPSGFVGSNSYRVPAGYADWYLVQSSAALDFLNEAAITGARSQPHGEVARAALDGSGKLMALESGEPDSSAGCEVGLSKPSGLGYAKFYELLRPWTSQAGVSLWRRMMVLGPPPEFCLVAHSPLELPADTRPQMRSREPF
jgi:hypothetical protein